MVVPLPRSILNHGLRQSHCDGHQLPRYRGNITPPADFDQWATRIRKLVGHWVERYEVEEIYGAEVIKDADGSLRVGPATVSQSALSRTTSRPMPSTRSTA